MSTDTDTGRYFVRPRSDGKFEVVDRYDVRPYMPTFDESVDAEVEALSRNRFEEEREQRERFDTGEPQRLPIPTAHLWLTVCRPDAKCHKCDGEGFLYNEDTASTDIACETCESAGYIADPVVDLRKLRAAAKLLDQLDQLGWRCRFDGGGYLAGGENYVEWLCLKRFPSMPAARAEVLGLDGVRTIGSLSGKEPEFDAHVNDGEGNDELVFAITLPDNTNQEVTA